MSMLKWCSGFRDWLFRVWYPGYIRPRCFVRGDVRVTFTADSTGGQAVEEIATKMKLDGWREEKP
jgi:hypothetical protein